MIWLILPLLAVAVPIYVLFFHGNRPHKDGQRLPQPKDTLPLLGNAIRFLQPRHTLFNWFLTQQQHFNGKTYAISVPSLPPGVVISDPANLEFVLKNETLVNKGTFFRTRAWDLFGHGIINATGSLWRVQRKAGLKFFNTAQLETLVDEVLPELWDSLIHPHLTSAAETGDVIDLQSLFHDLTTAIMGRTAYNLPALTAAHPFSKAFDYASAHIASRFQNPLYPLTELFTGQRFRAAVREVKAFGHSIVTSAKRRRGKAAFESLLDGNDAPTFTSLIDSLIESIDDEAIVADAAMNFLSAGRDTTAENLTWTVYALLRHPSVLARLRDELTTTHSSSSSERPTELATPTLPDLSPQSTPYLHATLSESLRLYPPVPLEIQQTTRNLTLPDGTFLPRDAIVVWCIHALNRSSALWGNDAETFRPERWLSESGEFAAGQKSAFEFPVFNGGPRMCLGKRMAEGLGGWVVSMLVLEGWEFEEVVAGGSNQGKNGGNGSGDGAARLQERRSAMSLTLPMEGGLPVRIRRRKTEDDP